MRILSHRGLWRNRAEQNTAAAFRRSFDAGFGLETDLRDLDGTVVVSHDPPTRGAMPFDELLELHARSGPSLTLALNVKSDGLQPLVTGSLARAGVQRWFVFDMAVPDMRGWLACGAPTFTRHSDHEPAPSFYDRSAGVWLDCFEREWYGEADLTAHLDAGKELCLVSPELHGRPHEAEWTRIGGWGALRSDAAMLCTDQPERAREVFDG